MGDLRRKFNSKDLVCIEGSPGWVDEIANLFRGVVSAG
jgi:hypothetical protein